MTDIRDTIFQNIADREFHAVLIPERDGCLSGVEDARKQAEEIGIRLSLFFDEGDSIKNGVPIARIIAEPGENCHGGGEDDGCPC